MWWNEELESLRNEQGRGAWQPQPLSIPLAPTDWRDFPEDQKDRESQESNRGVCIIER